MIDRRLIENFDWGLFALVLLLCVVGVVTLYSAVAAGEKNPDTGLVVKQAIWCGIGFMVMMAMICFDYKELDRWANLIYVAGVFLLICVLVYGKVAGGSQRWLVLGPISIQPSELTKLTIIVMLSSYYSKMVKSEGFSVRELIQPLIYTAIPFFLIVRQPDLGTAMIVLLIAASITVFVKIEKGSLIVISGFSALAGLILWFFLKDYQKLRIKTFLNPDLDPLGAGYHIIQSKIAIGSGMLTGKGFLEGSQNILSFLPEQHTDFIFSVFAEEWGFIGSLLLIGVFMVIIIRGLNIAYKCKDSFGVILSVGVTAMIFWQIFINIGMVMGLMPVVGVTLPFISYGGSSLITMMVCVGILLNVGMRRFIID